MKSTYINQLKRLAAVTVFVTLFLLSSSAANAQVSTLCMPIAGMVYCNTRDSRYYPPQQPYVPPAPAFPSEMTTDANWTYAANIDGTYDVHFTFNNPNNRNVSLSINPTQWADPGPDTDTSSNEWTFSSVPANTTQYINMKAMVNGTWSQITSWTIQVPTWEAPTDTPTPTPTSSTMIQVSASSYDGIVGFIVILLLLTCFAIASFLFHFKVNLSVAKRNKKKGKR